MYFQNEKLLKIFLIFENGTKMRNCKSLIKQILPCSDVSRVVLLPFHWYGIPNYYPKKSKKIKKKMLKKSLNYGYMTLYEQLTTSHNENKGIQGILPSCNGPNIPIFWYVEVRRKSRHTQFLFLFTIFI